MKQAPIDKILEPINRFIRNETSAGILLFLCALIAMLFANSPFSASYHNLWHTLFSIEFGDMRIAYTLNHWINDGLMAMFFFVIGLEIKREAIAGELSSPKNAILPIAAAFGGMVVPASIYWLLNPTGVESAGWGIPMATDIAFSLGVLSLLGSRVPLSLKIFLTTLAIADDLGAVLVIAFFYTSHISIDNLLLGAGALGILITANWLGVRSALFYFIVGIGGLWLAFLFSGIHPTIAGILAALAIPARSKIDEKRMSKELNVALKNFQSIPPNNSSLLHPKQMHIIEEMKQIVQAADTPLQRLEHQLHPWVAFLILPIFALANAGVEFHLDSLGAFFHPVSLGVGLGLLVGKFVGVLVSCFLVKFLRIATLPPELNWQTLAGAACLAGIGFTMSLFVTNLAFTDPKLITQAKLGILPASTVAGIIGYLVLNTVLPRERVSGQKG